MIRMLNVLMEECCEIPMATLLSLQTWFTGAPNLLILSMTLEHCRRGRLTKFFAKIYPYQLWDFSLHVV